MVKKIISSGSFPFSKAIIHNFKYTMEISGQIGIDPKTGKLPEGIEKQTHQALENMKKILEEAGWSFENIIKVKIYLTNMDDYAAVNEIYKKYFSSDYPTRVALAVKALPLGALIEIECTAGNDLF
ncbi:MAG: Rid family detoxifying hydrolase [Nanoarchaeota archaeon]